MAHSNQVREFVLTKHGAQLLDVYVGPRGVVTGSARLKLLAEDRTAVATRRDDIERRRMALDRRSLEVDSQVAALRAQFAAETAELERLIAEESRDEEARETTQASLADARGDGSTAQPDPGGQR